MLTRILMVAIGGIIAGGCSRQSIETTSIGGPYFRELTIVPCKKWYLMEPGNRNIERYLHVTTETTSEITRYLGGFDDSIYRHFNYRIYGSNFVYVERENGDWSKFRFRAFSAKNGNTTVDQDFRQYWKVIADEHGITCHRLQDGQERDDPRPTVYTAEYLSGL